MAERVEPIKIALLSDPASSQRKAAVAVALANDYPGMVDLGAQPDEDCSDNELALRFVAALNAGSVDCCIGFSLYGGGLQIYANKDPRVTAVPCSDEISAIEAINDYAANMCDISSRMPLEHAVAVAKTFLSVFRLRRELL